MQYMTAKEAAEALEISLSTLYSYVSRGLIRSEATSESHRQKRYYSEDIHQLLQRKEATKKPEKAAETALNWGLPVLESAITFIDENRLYYRGYDALKLAEANTIEEVTALIWMDDLTHAKTLFAGEPPKADPYLNLIAQLNTQHPYLTEMERW